MIEEPLTNHFGTDSMPRLISMFGPLVERYPWNLTSSASSMGRVALDTGSGAMELGTPGDLTGAAITGEKHRLLR